MAKITINADTDTNTLEVTVNGQMMSDISSVYMSLQSEYYDPDEVELSVCINSFIHDKESGVKTHTSLTAKESSEGRKLIKAGAQLNKKFPEFVSTKATNKAQIDCAKYFEQRGF